MGQITVLLVDDHLTLLQITMNFLGKEKDIVVVGTAAEGLEAIELAQELRPEIVVLDMALPDMSGLDVIPRFRQAIPELGIIALTGIGMEGYRKLALRVGADEFVEKADVNAELLPAIRHVAQEKRRTD